VIKESNSNNDKYAKRAKRTLDAYGYEDDISEQFCTGIAVVFIPKVDELAVLCK